MPGWRFCGAPAVTGVAIGDGVWCAAHRARVYAPRGERRLKPPDLYIREAGQMAARPRPTDDLPEDGTRGGNAA